jgi:ribonuclease HI
LSRTQVALLQLKARTHYFRKHGHNTQVKKDTGEGKSSQWAELRAVHMVLQFVCKKKWPDVRLFTDSWAVANGLAGWSGTWKDHNWKIGEKDIWGRSMWIDLSKWAKDVKIFVSHVNAHQKVTSDEEEFNNQVDKAQLPFVF